MASHRFAQEFQCSLAIAGLGHKAPEDLALVIDGPPQVVLLSVDLHENFVEMPSPLARSHPLHPALADAGSEQRADPVLPVTYGLVADVDAALVQQVLDVAQ